MENLGKNKYFEIGQRIKSAREKEGVTQAELAKRLQYNSATAVSLIEAGERKVKIDDLELIADFLHRDLDYFIYGEAKKAPDLQTALRAVEGFTKSDIEKAQDYIQYLRSLKKDKRDGE